MPGVNDGDRHMITHLATASKDHVAVAASNADRLHWVALTVNVPAGHCAIHRGKSPPPPHAG
jgi:hypothetical protein